jgi:hypothetical protein
MPYYRQSSNSFRYLRARLRPVTRPIVWAPATVLAVLVVFVWDFWVNQREFAWNFNLQPTDSGLSSDDQAFGADIDNLSVLINDFNLLATNPTNQQKGQAVQPIPGSGNSNNRAPSSGLLSTNASAGQLLAGSSLQIGGTNAFAGTSLLGGSPAATNSLLSTNSGLGLSGNSGLGLSGNSGLGLSGITTVQSPTLPANVLQQALTANQTQNSTNTSANPTSGNAPTLANGLRQPLPPTNFPTLPTQASAQTPSNTGFPTLPTLPGQTTTPATATTGTSNAVPINSYTALTGGSSTAGVSVPSVPAPAVPTPSNFGQSPFNSNPFGQPGQFGNVPNPQAQQQQFNQSPNAPISPRAPGRYLGGGQINSFSDPLGTSNPGN